MWCSSLNTNSQSNFPNPVRTAVPFGTKPLEFKVIRPQNGTTVLKGLPRSQPHIYSYNSSTQDISSSWECTAVCLDHSSHYQPTAPAQYTSTWYMMYRQIIRTININTRYLVCGIALTNLRRPRLWKIHGSQEI